MKKEKIILAVIFLLGLFIRAYNFNAVNEFVSNDSVAFVFMALNIFNYKSLFILNPKYNLIAALFSFQYGFVLPCLIYVLFLLLTLLKIQILESYVFLLIAFLGSLIIIGVYLIIKELTGDKILALLSSLYVCIEPDLIGQSRTPGNNVLTGLSVEVFAVYFIIKYFKNKNSKDGLWASLLVGLFISATNIFLLIIPLIIYIGYIYIRNIKELFKLIFRKETIIFPLLILGMYFLAFMYLVIHHLDLSSNLFGKLITKPKAWNFYFMDLSGYYIENCGFVIFGLILLGICYGIYKTIKLSKESIVFIWGFIFAFPFLFFTPPYATVVRATLSDSQMAFGMLGVLALYDASKTSIKIKKYAFSAIIAALFIFTLIFSCGFNYSLSYYRKLPLGAVRYLNISESGAKACGFYVRENIGLDKKIFTDLEPVLSHFYFGRTKVFAQYDAGPEDNLRYLKEIIKGIDIISIKAEDENIYKPVLTDNKFEKIVIITSEGKPLRYIYSRERKNLVYLDNKETVNEFNKKYATLKNLLPCYIGWPAENKPLP